MTDCIGIFGGTFDPPHLGHLILAAEARARLSLTRLLWVLTPIPPHKMGQTITPLTDRLAMVQLAVADDSAFEVSRIEMDRPGPHYAVDTVKILAEQNPGAELYYLIGGDSLRDLPTWHHPADLVFACHALGVMRRPDAEFDLAGLETVLPGVKEKVLFIDSPLLEISSHEIRQRIAAGMPFRYYLTPAVYAYIQEHNLYRG